MSQNYKQFLNVQLGARNQSWCSGRAAGTTGCGAVSQPLSSFRNWETQTPEKRRRFSLAYTATREICFQILEKAKMNFKWIVLRNFGGFNEKHHKGTQNRFKFINYLVFKSSYYPKVFLSDLEIPFILPAPIFIMPFLFAPKELKFSSI